MTLEKLAKLSQTQVWNTLLALLRNNLPKTPQGDELFSVILFLLTHRRLPNNGPYMNDVLSALKTSGELANPLRVFTTDKEFVKLYIKAKVGDEYNVPTLAVLKSSREVDDYPFPEHCFIKPTHSSGDFLYHEPGVTLDRAEIKSWFGINFYEKMREANYKDLKPKVIVEPIIFGNKDLTEYKIHCWRGEAKVATVVQNRFSDRTVTEFDMNWDFLPIDKGYKQVPDMPKPANFDEMIQVTQTLAADFGLVRVDIFNDGKTLYVGELTHCNGAGLGRYKSVESEALMSQAVFSPPASGPQ
ncbi:MAG: hypothetical protein GC184_10895 [Rhizobiales bacterium]|nr:hypothetical protein [Hyphomicrobiales bacterium]